MVLVVTTLDDLLPERRLTHGVTILQLCHNRGELLGQRRSLARLRGTSVTLGVTLLQMCLRPADTSRWRACAL